MFCSKKCHNIVYSQELRGFTYLSFTGEQIASTEKFEGCRLCRRAPKLEEAHINSSFGGFLDSWEHFNLVRIELSSICRRNFVNSLNIVPKLRPRLLKKRILALCQKLTFIMVLRDTAWGKMSVMTVGSFHVFMEEAAWTCVYSSKFMFHPTHTFPASLWKQFISV